MKKTVLFIALALAFATLGLGASEAKKAIEKSHFLVKFKSQLSLNVSVAGSIVMYDRGINKPRS